MFQTTRRRLALWYTAVTAVLLLLFASGFYWYVHNTLVERVDDTLNHVVEVVQRSLVIEPLESRASSTATPSFHVNLEASFRSNADAVEDDHIDLEWFDASGQLIWSTFSAPLDIVLHINDGETVRALLQHEADEDEANRQDVNTILESSALTLRQVTHPVRVGTQIVGYLRVSHPWFEVSKPSRQLIRDLGIGTGLVILVVGAIGWFLSGLAMAPVRDSYQRLKQFTADASHELRNPIAVIQTNVQVALADPDPHLQQDQLKVIERLTRRLGRLVDDLLFLARQDGGITPLKLEPVYLKELLQEVLEEQRAIATEKQITVSLLLPDTSSTVNVKAAPSSSAGLAFTLQADRDQLIRLFTNLISNAIQYTPSGGQVQVILQRLKHSGHSQLQIQIKDTGIGIPAESLPHLFNRFYRVDPARTAANPQRSGSATTTGSGLGLAIANVIVEKHQGQIQVESTPHQGTTFTILLPYHMPSN